MTDFKRIRTFAYDGSGLNLSFQGARNYAQPKMEEKAFVCNNL